MAKPPAAGLRIVSVEVGHKLIIREVPQTRAVISHAIGLARQVERALLVAEHSLVHRLKPQKVCGWPRAGCSSLGRPPVRGGVVSAGGRGPLGEIPLTGEDVVVGDVASKLQLRIVDRAMRVAE